MASSNKEPVNHSVYDLLRQGEAALSLTSSSPRLDSELLLRYILSLSQSGLILALSDLCSDSTRQHFCELIERRKGGEPIAYIIGEREFWGLSFHVNRDVLVPRPESELLVSEVAKICGRRDRVQLLDLGTGSGCIAIALIKELKGLGCRQVVCDGVDVSQPALEVAKLNAQRHGVLDELRLIHTSWCREASKLSPPYDFIVANPPYLDRSEVTPVELSFEPAGALFSDELGLADTAEIIQTALPLLAPKGSLFVEVGANKGPIIEGVVKEALNRADLMRDFVVSYLGDTAKERDSFRVVRIISHPAKLSQSRPLKAD